MTLVEQLAFASKRMKKAGASKKAAEDSGNVPEKRVEDMTLDEQLAYSAKRLKKGKGSRPASPIKEKEMEVIVEETNDEDIPDRSAIDQTVDSFCTDDSMIGMSVADSVILPSKDEDVKNRMTTIMEDDLESRQTTMQDS